MAEIYFITSVISINSKWSPPVYCAAYHQGRRPIHENIHWSNYFYMFVDCSRIDIILTLDESGSIGDANWKNVVDFGLALMDRLELSDTASHITVVRYSTVAQVSSHGRKINRNNSIINPYNAEINQKIKGFVQFEIIINLSVSSICYIWKTMLWVYGLYNFLILSVWGSTLDVRIWRLLSVSSLIGLTYKSLSSIIICFT